MPPPSNCISAYTRRALPNSASFWNRTAKTQYWIAIAATRLLQVCCDPKEKLGLVGRVFFNIFFHILEECINLQIQSTAACNKSIQKRGGNTANSIKLDHQLANKISLFKFILRKDIDMNPLCTPKPWQANLWMQEHRWSRPAHTHTQRIWLRRTTHVLLSSSTVLKGT